MMRFFWKYCMRHDIVSENRFSNLHGIKVGHRKKKKKKYLYRLFIIHQNRIKALPLQYNNFTLVVLAALIEC